MASPFIGNITELGIFNVIDGLNMETTARNLVNLERVYLRKPKAEYILSLIRYSAKLKKLKVDERMT